MMNTIISDITFRDFVYILSLSGIFVGILMFTAAVYHLIVEPISQRRLKSQRLLAIRKSHLFTAQILKDDLKPEKSPLFTLLEKAIGKPLGTKLQRSLLQADIFWTPGKFLAVALLLCTMSFLLALLWVQNLLLGFGLALATGLGLLLYLKWKRARKSSQFEMQMPDAMQLLARSLRAGHTLPSAMELLSQESAPPLATEMRITFDQQRYGLSMNEALVQMADRVDSRDLKYWVTAVLIQSETGGNLTEVMDKIGQIIRERLNFKGKVRALTAEGRFSAKVLMTLPIVMFFVVLTISPEYELMLVRETIGQKLLIIGTISMLIGYYFINKIVKSVEV
ncbi:MAG: type II secretion system F family protein [Desulfobacteraceae bacterium]